MPRALITGITGQDGRHLAQLLVAKGYDVFGLVCDSVLFLWLAFGNFDFLWGQIVGKTWVTLAFLPFLIVWRGQWRALVDVPAE